MVAHREKLLRAAPYGQLAVTVPERGRGVRLYVALMHCLRVELALHYRIRLCEALLHIPVIEDKMVSDIRLLVAIAVAAGAKCGACHCKQSLVQYRRALCHRIIGGQSGRQHLIVHINQLRRFLCQMLARSRDRGDRMSHVQRLLARHDIAAEEAVVDRRALFLIDELGGRIRKVGSRDDRMHSRHRQRPARIDSANAGMGVRAANDLRVQQTGHRRIRGVARASGDLVHPVVTHGPRTHDSELFVRQNHVGLVIEHRHILPV